MEKKTMEVGNSPVALGWRMDCKVVGGRAWNHALGISSKDCLKWVREQIKRSKGKVAQSKGAGDWENVKGETVSGEGHIQKLTQ